MSALVPKNWVSDAVSKHWGNLPSMTSFYTTTSRTVACTLAAALLYSTPVHAQTAALGAYNAPLRDTSISGISSGAYMSVQFATAWSSFIKGVGVIAGGPYGCSGGSGATALSTCMMGQPKADVESLYKLSEDLAAKGRIDNPANIANQKIYLFNGYNDAVVYRPVTNWLDTIYEKRLSESVGNLFYQTAVGAGHSQVTLTYGGTCPANGGKSSPAFINDCDYDQAGIILQHIYGALNAPNHGKLHGELIAFKQDAYTAPAQPAEHSMGAKAFVYVPADCAAGAACRVHVAVHGCKQSFDNIGETFVRHAGYNEWADTNRIIVLYPQTTPSFGVAPYFGVTNPEACWDWWGYLDKDPTTDPRFLTKEGPQIVTIKKMIDRLTSGTKPAGAAAPVKPALIVNDFSDKAIALAWTAVPNALSYDVLRAGPGETNPKGVATVSGLSFGDSGLKPKTAYRYQVRPILAGGPEPAIDTVTQQTHAAVPTCIDPGHCKVVK
jgi:hypothetical protein